MKERPILFSAPMVRAVLDGSKTQTRRICKASKQAHADIISYAIQQDMLGADDGTHEKAAWERIGCPYGQPGYRLWVKETWYTSRCLDHCKPTDLVQGAGIQYRADGWNDGFGMSDPGKTRVAIFMRRWMSRILLEIVSIRVERLQDISEEDAESEGVRGLYFRVNCNPKEEHFSAARDAFQHLWKSINGPGSWDENPFVWVVEFKRVEVKR